MQSIMLRRKIYLPTQDTFRFADSIAGRFSTQNEYRRNRIEISLDYATTARSYGASFAAFAPVWTHRTLEPWNARNSTAGEYVHVYDSLKGRRQTTGWDERSVGTDVIYLH